MRQLAAEAEGRARGSEGRDGRRADSWSFHDHCTVVLPVLAEFSHYPAIRLQVFSENTEHVEPVVVAGTPARDDGPSS
jgi:hypothetical protein